MKKLNKKLNNCACISITLAMLVTSITLSIYTVNSTVLEDAVHTTRDECLMFNMQPFTFTLWPCYSSL